NTHVFIPRLFKPGLRTSFRAVCSRAALACVRVSSTLFLGEGQDFRVDDGEAGIIRSQVRVIVLLDVGMRYEGYFFRMFEEGSADSLTNQNFLSGPWREQKVS